MWRANCKKERKKRKRLVLGEFFFGGGGRETDLRSGEFDRFGRYLDEEFLDYCGGGGGDISFR